MNLTSKFLEVFNNKNTSFEEITLSFKAKSEISFDKMPSLSEIKSIIPHIHERDNKQIILNIVDEYYLDIHLDTEEASYKEFIEKAYDAENIIKISLNIEKKISENTLSVYNYDEFAKCFIDVGMHESFNLFSFMLKGLDYLIFEIFDKEIYIETDTLLFIHHENKLQTKTDFIKRNYLLKAGQEISYFFDLKSIQLIPNDFKVQNSSIDNDILILEFKKYEYILSVVYLSVQSNIENNSLKFKITRKNTDGYTIDFNNIDYSDCAFKIYNWVYNEGNLIDKSLIAQEIIESSNRNSDGFSINQQTYDSIKSNYNLYLKDNVKNYIELKNKISELIFDMTNKLIDYQSSLANNIKNNISILITYFLSVIVLNVISGETIKSAFSPNIIFLFEIILILSIPYVCISIIESLVKINKITDGFKELKRNYSTILSENDLNNAFNELEFEKLKNSTKNKIIGYCILWILSLIIATIILEMYNDWQTLSLLIPHIKKP